MVFNQQHLADVPYGLSIQVRANTKIYEIVDPRKENSGGTLKGLYPGQSRHAEVSSSKAYYATTSDDPENRKRIEVAAKGADSMYEKLSHKTSLKYMRDGFFDINTNMKKQLAAAADSNQVVPSDKLDEYYRLFEEKLNFSCVQITISAFRKEKEKFPGCAFAKEGNYYYKATTLTRIYTSATIAEVIDNLALISKILEADVASTTTTQIRAVRSQSDGIKLTPDRNTTMSVTNRVNGQQVSLDTRTTRGSSSKEIVDRMTDTAQVTGRGILGYLKVAEGNKPTVTPPNG